MTHHELVIHDGAETQDAMAPPVVESPPPKGYRVVNELFKRGRAWAPGEVITLDAATASRFIEAGDIEEIDEP